MSHDYIWAAHSQHDFLMLLPGNTKFQAYHKERKQPEQDRIDGVLERCRDLDRWRRMDVLTSNLTCHFKRIHKLCSKENMPLSAYPLLVQTLKNDINRGLTEEFDEVLGEGARAEIVRTLRVRFNMDGRDPSGQKVGLLDEHHFMAYLCDPAGHEWRSKFKIQTELAPLMRKMINMYVPLDRDGLPTSRKRVLKEFRVSTVCVTPEIALSFSFIICHETNEHRSFIPSRVNGCTSLKILFRALFQKRS